MATTKSKATNKSNGSSVKKATPTTNAKAGKAKATALPKAKATKASAKKATTKPAATAKGAVKRAAKDRGATKKAVPVAKLPTAKQVAEMVGGTLVPPLKAAQIQRLKRALPGYVSVLDDVADLIAEDAADLNLKEITPDMLLDVQSRQKALAAREAVLEAAYTSIYHQRLSTDDEAIGLLRTIARRVQSRAEENPDLPIRYKVLLDFLGTFTRGANASKG